MVRESLEAQWARGFASALLAKVPPHTMLLSQTYTRPLRPIPDAASSLHCMCSAQPAFQLYRNGPVGGTALAIAAATTASSRWQDVSTASRQHSRTDVELALHYNAITCSRQNVVQHQRQHKQQQLGATHMRRSPQACCAAGASTSTPLGQAPGTPAESASSTGWSDVLRQAQPHAASAVQPAVSEVAADIDEMERQWRLPPHEWRPHPTLLSG